MSERIKAARAEAERYMHRVMPYDTMADHYSAIAAFMDGVVWADANPRPCTITLAQSEAILEAGRTGRYEDHEAALRAAGIEVDDAIDVPTHCAACGKPAEGFAMINDERFCHPDEGPSCYMGVRS